MLIRATSPWDAFLKARLLLIHEWARDGIPGVEGEATPEKICVALNHHDPTQIRLLLTTDASYAKPPEVAVLVANSVTTTEAEVIADQIDPRAGGFFRQALVRAVKEGARLQREKLKGKMS